ncbi:hypothetical protein TNCV_2198871 [Trichonephila clavipes]|nr:hypothetical protein TNCV_2198871 [Trichonephila clavipes]
MGGVVDLSLAFCPLRLRSKLQILVLPKTYRVEKPFTLCQLMLKILSLASCGRFEKGRLPRHLAVVQNYGHERGQSDADSSPGGTEDPSCRG